MDTRTVGERLREPFPLESLGWKPQAVKNNRALAVTYIDARDVMDRLDAVVGCENWHDEYKLLDGGMVLCKLSVCINGQWIAKTDVGGESEQPDAGDRLKAAFSDALKRAAVKFGIGRYLYSMPSVWCDYDAVKKQFTETPRVAAQFLPAKAGAPKPEAPKPAPQPQPPQPAKPQPAKQYPDFFGFLDQIATATVPADLAAVWDDINAARKANAITDGERQELLIAKDARKAVLAGNASGALFDNSKPVGVPH